MNDNNEPDVQEVLHTSTANELQNTLKPTSNSQNIKELISDNKKLKAEALKNAKQALEEAFGEKCNDVGNKKLEKESDEIIPDLMEEFIVYPPVSEPVPISTTKGYKETKELMDNFRKKIKEYPKSYLSHEGSTVLCVLLSISKTDSVIVSMNGLPATDRKMILDLLPEKYIETAAYFKVMFDKQRDFVLTFDNEKIDSVYSWPDLEKEDSKENDMFIIILFNTIIHPQMSKIQESVPIEKEGEKISIGDRIILDKKTIQNRVNTQQCSPPSTTPLSELTKEEIISRRQPVSGRNAFEIRSDLVQMSMDLLFHNNKSVIPPEDVIKTAKIFYTFVENRR